MDVDERRAYEGVISRAAEIALSNPSAFIELFVRDEKNRPIVQAPLHRDMQREWTRSRYSIMVVPREHGKTTQALHRIAWEIIRDTNLRVKIVAATDGLAVKRVEAISGILAQEGVQRHYPWVRFVKGKHPKKEFTLQRSATHSLDSTVCGVGILGEATGGRADLIVMDDVVSMRNAITLAALRKRVIDAFFSDYFQMLGPDARLWYISTPWHDSDLTSFLMTGKETEKKPDIFRRTVTDDLVSPWPERWSQERLRDRKASITPGAFARGFFLQTVSDTEAICFDDWIQEEPVSSSSAEAVILGIDPASGEQGKTDYTAVSVLETHGKFSLLRDVIRFRVPLPAQIERIMELRKALRPEYIAVEVVGVQRWMLQTLLDQGCSEAIASDPITGNKSARFRVLGLRHKQGALRLPIQKTAGLNIYRDELLGFPAAEHDDTLDAVSLALKAAENARLVEPGYPALGEVGEMEDRGMSLEDFIVIGDGRDDGDRDEWAGW